MPPTDPDEFRMSFGDHLDELRGRLVKAIGGIVLAACFTLMYGQDLIELLVEPLNRAQIAEGLPPITVTRSPMAPFMIYIKVSLISAIIIAAPWVVYQLWKFISAGLYAHEKKVIHILAPFSGTMTVLAVAFMYYVMLPVSLAFFMLFAVSYGPSGGDSSNPVAFLTRSIKAIMGGDEGKRLERVGPISPELGTIFDNDSSKAAGVTWKLETGPQRILDGSILNVPSLAEDPEEPVEGQIWVNTKKNSLKIVVGERVMVAQLSVSSLVSPLIELGEYISFVVFMTLGIVIAFQVPVIMTIGGAMGVMNSAFFINFRKHVILICVVMGAVLTPSDPISMLVLAVPLYLLFEFGLLIIRTQEKTKARKAAEEE